MTVLLTDGLDAVSMRRVAAELNISPIPVYDRVGNKEALLDAMAARVTEDFAPAPRDGEPWTDYATRWCHQLRDRRLAVPDHRLFVRIGRSAAVAAAAPLVDRLVRDGFTNNGAVAAARLLMWAVFGHVAVELGRTEGGDADSDALFDQHITLLIHGLSEGRS